MAPSRPLPKGIYTPLPCFFFEGTEDIDYDTYKKHVQFTASADTIPVISGTMGEAPHLTSSERTLLITHARSALDSLSLNHMPIIAGCGATSTRESISLAHEAAAAGADYVIVLSPGFFAGSLQINGGSALKQYFLDIANASPVPVLMYNFPAMTGGIDFDSDFILEVAKASPNICGIKLTCGNVGKLTRITSVVNSPAFKKDYPRSNPNSSFLVIDGFIDFLLPSMASNSSGAITGLANFAPRTCVKLWTLCSSPTTVTSSETQSLQNIISNADGIALKVGIPGMKALLASLFGYPPNPRLPLLPMSVVTAEEILTKPAMKALLDYEAALST